MRSSSRKRSSGGASGRERRIEMPYPRGEVSMAQRLVQNQRFRIEAALRLHARLQFRLRLIRKLHLDREPDIAADARQHQLHPAIRECLCGRLHRHVVPQCLAQPGEDRTPLDPSPRCYEPADAAARRTSNFVVLRDEPDRREPITRDRLAAMRSTSEAGSGASARWWLLDAIVQLIQLLHDHIRRGAPSFASTAAISSSDRSAAATPDAKQAHDVRLRTGDSRSPSVA
jgi:hypothetical protein